MDSVIELAEDDELDRELAHLCSWYGDVPPWPVISDGKNNVDQISERRPLSGSALLASGTDYCSTMLSPADDDYDREFDLQLQDGTPALSHRQDHFNLDEDAEEDKLIGRPSKASNGRAKLRKLHAQSLAASNEGSVV